MQKRILTLVMVCCIATNSLWAQWETYKNQVQELPLTRGAYIQDEPFLQFTLTGTYLPDILYRTYSSNLEVRYGLPAGFEISAAAGYQSLDFTATPKNIVGLSKPVVGLGYAFINKPRLLVSSFARFSIGLPYHGMVKNNHFDARLAAATQIGKTQLHASAGWVSDGFYTDFAALYSIGNFSAALEWHGTKYEDALMSYDFTNYIAPALFWRKNKMEFSVSMPLHTSVNKPLYPVSNDKYITLYTGFIAKALIDFEGPCLCGLSELFQ